MTPGNVLAGRYRIEGLLGAGGMGAVYLARDLRFRESPVAVKETLVDRNREDLRKAFEREAMLLYHLRHRALPRVIDYFRDRDSEFLVMEYISGDDVASLVERRGAPFDVETVLRWGGELIEVVAYLHGHSPSIIHRDIKPLNLKLTPDGRIVLLDFGLAKGAAGGAIETTSASIVAGTRSFSPPEQLAGQGTDERSDLFSIASTLYQLLTGTLPVDAAVRSAALINGEPDPLVIADRVNASIPHQLALALHEGMQLRRDRRPPTVEAFGRRLKEAAVGIAGATTVETFVEPVSPLVGLPGSGPTLVEVEAHRSSDGVRSPGLSARGTYKATIVERTTEAPTTDARRSRRVRAAVAIATAVVLVAMGTLVRMAYGPAESTNTTPVKNAQAPPRVPQVRFRVERADGQEVVGKLPKNVQLRVRLTASIGGIFGLVSVNPDSTTTLVFSDRTASTWGLSNASLQPNVEFSFPGRDVPLRVRTGEERLLLVVVPSAIPPPAALTREPFEPLPAGDVVELDDLLARTTADGEPVRDGLWWRLDRSGAVDELVSVVAFPR